MRRWTPVAMILTLGALVAACVPEETAETAAVSRRAPAPPPGVEYEARAEKALDLLSQDRGEEALAEARAALEIAPLNREPYELLSRIYTESEQDDAAIDRFRELTERYPDVEHAWYYKGAHETRLKLWEDARASFERVLTVDPGHADGHYALARVVLAVSGNFDAALEHLRVSHELDPQSKHTVLELERILRVHGDYEAAEQVLTAALERLPQSAELHHRLALLKSRQGLQDEAEALLRRAIALGSGLSTAHRDLGQLLIRSGREAEGRFRLALAQRWDDYYRLKPDLLTRMKERPTDPEIPLVLAELEIVQAQLGDALTMFTKSESLGGPAQRIAAGRAWALLYMDNSAAADVELAKIADWDDARADVVRAGRLIRKRKIREAVRLLDRAVERAPPDRTFLRWASDLYGYAGQGSTAAALLHRAEQAPAIEESVLSARDGPESP